jgi:preprotein translocase subunit SecD
MSHHGMTRNDWVRFAIVVLVAVGSLYLLYPFWPLSDVVKLGLDLQGGVRMILEMEGADQMTDTERQEKIDQVVTILNTRTDQYGLANTEIRQYDDRHILVSIPGESGKWICEECDYTYDVAKGDPLSGIEPGTPFSDLPEDWRCPGCPETVTKASFVPSYEDARKLIGQTAVLEFRKAIEIGTSALDDLVPSSNREEVLRNDQGVPYIVERTVRLTGDALTNAVVRTGQTLQTAGQYIVALTFSQQGAEEFAKILIDLGADAYLAIILDNVVYSAPRIDESIVRLAREQGWRGVQDQTSITNIRNQEDARILAVVLRAGALPVAIQIVDEETVGPTLGADSIRRGIMTILIGFVLIVIYMFAYYRILGFVANIALVLNMLIVFAALVLFQAVLTLPGIAGIILTIGMTVDANVIIFERVKEERRTGKSPLAAVRSGFEKSLSTLLDANVTTLITALILLLLGTGPIRGFAITLGIGIVGSLFCALVASRMLLERAGFAEFIPVKVAEESS